MTSSLRRARVGTAGAPARRAAAHLCPWREWYLPPCAPYLPPCRTRVPSRVAPGDFYMQLAFVQPQLFQQHRSTPIAHKQSLQACDPLVPSPLRCAAHVLLHPAHRPRHKLHKGPGRQGGRRSITHSQLSSTGRVAAHSPQRCATSSRSSPRPASGRRSLAGRPTATRTARCLAGAAHRARMKDSHQGPTKHSRSPRHSCTHTQVQ